MENENRANIIENCQDREVEGKIKTDCGDNKTDGRKSIASTNGKCKEQSEMEKNDTGAVEFPDVSNSEWETNLTPHDVDGINNKNNSPTKDKTEADTLGGDLKSKNNENMDKKRIGSESEKSAINLDENNTNKDSHKSGKTKLDMQGSKVKTVNEEDNENGNKKTKVTQDSWQELHSAGTSGDKKRQNREREIEVMDMLDKIHDMVTPLRDCYGPIDYTAITSDQDGSIAEDYLSNIEDGESSNEVRQEKRARKIIPCMLWMKRPRDVDISEVYEGIADTINEKEMIAVHPTRDGRIEIQVKDRVSAQKLVSEGVNIIGEWYQVFALGEKALKVILCNVPPFVTSEAIAEACIQFGATTAEEIQTTRVITNKSKFKHLVTFRREMLIKLKKEAKIPEFLSVPFGSRTYYIETIVPETRCRRCGGGGHIIAFCDGKTEENKEITEMKSDNPLYFDETPEIKLKKRELLGMDPREEKNRVRKPTKDDTKREILTWAEILKNTIEKNNRYKEARNRENSGKKLVYNEDTPQKPTKADNKQGAKVDGEEKGEITKQDEIMKTDSKQTDRVIAIDKPEGSETYMITGQGPIRQTESTKEREFKLKGVKTEQRIPKEKTGQNQETNGKRRGKETEYSDSEMEYTISTSKKRPAPQKKEAKDCIDENSSEENGKRKLRKIKRKTYTEKNSDSSDSENEERKELSRQSRLNVKGKSKESNIVKLRNVITHPEQESDSSAFESEKSMQYMKTRQQGTGRKTLSKRNVIPENPYSFENVRLYDRDDVLFGPGDLTKLAEEMFKLFPNESEEEQYNKKRKKTLNTIIMNVIIDYMTERYQNEENSKLDLTNPQIRYEYSVLVTKMMRVPQVVKIDSELNKREIIRQKENFSDSQVEKIYEEQKEEVRQKLNELIMGVVSDTNQ